MTNLSTDYLLHPLEVAEGYVFRCAMRMWLAAGDYFVTFGVAHGHGRKCDFLEDGFHFKVVGAAGLFSSSLVNLEPELELVDGAGAQLPERR